MFNFEITISRKIALWKKFVACFIALTLALLLIPSGAVAYAAERSYQSGETIYADSNEIGKLKEALDIAYPYFDFESRYIPESWSDFVAAYNNCESILNKKQTRPITKQEVEDATNRLLNAIKYLVSYASLEYAKVLEEDINQYYSLLFGDREIDYTVPTWENFVSAANNAKDVLFRFDCCNTTDSEMLSAINSYNDAYAGLTESAEPVPSDNELSHLNEVITHLEETYKLNNMEDFWDQNSYIPETWSSLIYAYTTCKSIYEKAILREASSKDIDFVIILSTDAELSLRIVADSKTKSDLRNTIMSSHQVFDGQELSYTKQTWQRYADALKRAEDVDDRIDRGQLVPYDEAKAVTINLENTRSLLKHSVMGADKPSILDIFGLQSNISYANDYVEKGYENDYTKASWDNLIEKLNEAINVQGKADDRSATVKEVNDASTILYEAFMALEETPNSEQIFELKANMAQFENLSYKDYTLDSFGECEKYYNECKDALESVKVRGISSDDFCYISNCLKESLDFLIPAPTDKEVQKLSDFVEQFKSINETNFTVSTWPKLKDAFEFGSKILAKSDNRQASEDEVISANERFAEAFADAVDSAKPIVSENAITQLQELVDCVEEQYDIRYGNALLYPEIHLAEYTEKTWNSFIYAYLTCYELLPKAYNREASNIEVLDAINLLEFARSSLRHTCSYELIEKLGQLIDDTDYIYNDEDWSDYTKSTWDRMRDVLRHAKDVYAKVESGVELTAEEVYEAIKDLREWSSTDNKHGKLRKAPRGETRPLYIDVQGLEDAINDVDFFIENTDESLYTKSSWDAMLDVLNNAKDIRERVYDRNAKKSTVLRATAELKASLDSLIKVPWDLEIANLYKSIAKYDYFKMYKEFYYTKSSWNNVVDAYNAANNCLAKLEQREVSATEFIDAASALESAIENLVELPSAVVIANLYKAVAKCDCLKMFKAYDYTKSSWNNVFDAYDAANNCLAKLEQREGTDAEFIDAANALESAIKNLVALPSADVIANLYKAIAKCDYLKMYKKYGYTKSSWNNVFDAYDAANNCLAKLEQREVTASEFVYATNNLEFAIDNLVEGGSYDDIAKFYGLFAKWENLKVNDRRHAYTNSSLEYVAKIFNNELYIKEIVDDHEATKEEIVSANCTLEAALSCLVAAPTHKTLRVADKMLDSDEMWNILIDWDNPEVYKPRYQKESWENFINAYNSFNDIVVSAKKYNEVTLYDYNLEQDKFNEAKNNLIELASEEEIATLQSLLDYVGMLDKNYDLTSNWHTLGHVYQECLDLLEKDKNFMCTKEEAINAINSLNAEIDSLGLK